MSGVTQRMLEGEHEQVVFVADAPTGLRGIIAVHSTALGPSLGGIRFWPYRHEADALTDVLRLSRAMTLKAAAAGLDQGGGKAVVLVDDADAPRSRDFLHAFGRAIHELGGRYLAAEDVGATTRDMDVIAEVTPWVTGVSEQRGGSGDPSPVTAVGVVHGMRAALHALDGEPDVRGRRVVVQGAGKVGGCLVALLTDAGAQVTVADLLEERAAEVASAHGAAAVPADRVLLEPCDVLCPCALGGVLTREVVPALRCRVVCGAANNQLAEAVVDDRLADAGIVYAPDFLVNAGGIINIAEEFVGYDRGRALAATARIETITAEVLAEASALGVAPGGVAESRARRRLAAAGASRWQSGDPTAWTHGAPLHRLRP